MPVARRWGLRRQAAPGLAYGRPPRSPAGAPGLPYAIMLPRGVAQPPSAVPLPAAPPSSMPADWQLPAARKPAAPAPCHASPAAAALGCRRRPSPDPNPCPSVPSNLPRPLLSAPPLCCAVAQEADAAVSCSTGWHRVVQQLQGAAAGLVLSSTRSRFQSSHCLVFPLVCPAASSASGGGSGPSKRPATPGRARRK